LVGVEERKSYPAGAGRPVVSKHIFGEPQGRIAGNAMGAPPPGVIQIGPTDV
jgi:hypothetical protein